jgi:4-aminobutyrate aminotransferase-like enzyme
MAPPASIINDGNVVEDSTVSKKDLISIPAASSNDGVNSAVLHRSLHHEPLRVISAKGNYLHLNNGQKIFDATGGAAVACIGHGVEQ